MQSKRETATGRVRKDYTGRNMGQKWNQRHPLGVMNFQS